MKPKHIAMVFALGFSAWLALFADKTPDSAVAPVARERTREAAPTISAATNSVPMAEHGARLLALRARNRVAAAPTAGAEGDESAERDEPAEPVDTTHGFFASHSWTPPPKVEKPPPPPPPTAPPLPYLYLGKQMSGGRLEVYLARGEDIVIARENATLDGIYRVVSIAPPTLSLVYLPLNQTQQILIGTLN